MRLNKFMEQLQKILDENPHAGELKMFGTVGSSGVSEEIGYPFLRKVSAYADGDLLELTEGEEYIDVYLGN